VKSIAAPITIGLPFDDDELLLVPEPELAEPPPLALLLLLLEPHPATIRAAVATSASAVTEPLNFLMSSSLLLV
jgi:hypothetical protein